MENEVTRDYYKCLIIGKSGSGKTYGARTLNPETTGFINTELKPLSFKNNFKYHAKPKKFAGIVKALEDYSENDEINCIVLDSLTSANEKSLAECNKNFKGYDIFKQFNENFARMMDLIKDAPKEVIVTGIYEILTIEGEFEKRFKISGKQWEGLVEKEFVITLYADNAFKDNKPNYYFKTIEQGTSAKCPPEILGEDVYKIDNDYQFLLDKIWEFTGVTKSLKKKVA